MDKEKDNDISELDIPDIEHYLDLHKKEIMDFLMNKIFKDAPQRIKIIDNIFDRLVNQLTKDVPFGTMIQFALANALIYSLWCGLQSQRLKTDKELNFKDEYVEQIQEAITKAFAIGRNYQL